MAAIGTPTNFIVQQGNGEVLASWDQVAGATAYKVYRSTDNSAFTLLDTVTEFEYLDSTVALNTQYYYKIAATIGSADSNYTLSQSIIPTQTGDESLASLRLQAQQRADRVNSQFVTKSEWNSYINKAAQELYDLLITVYEDYKLAEEYTFVTDGLNGSYPLPNGTLIGTDGVTTKPFYKLMGVDCAITSNENGGNQNARITVHKYDYIERNRYVYPNISATFFGVFNMRYRVMGNNIKFIPVPSTGQYITLHYIPRMPILLKDTDVADGINGWTEYVIVDAAIRALQKEESDVSVLMAQKMALKQRIEESATNRDAGIPDVISNSRAWSGRGGQGGGPGYDGSWGGF